MLDYVSYVGLKNDMCHMLDLKKAAGGGFVCVAPPQLLWA